MKDKLHSLLKSPQNVDRRPPAIGGILVSNKLDLPYDPCSLVNHCRAGMCSTGPSEAQLGKQLEQLVIGGWNLTIGHLFMSAFSFHAAAGKKASGGRQSH